MCGIAGIIGENATAHSEQVKAMLTALIHRGPDGNGLYNSPKNVCSIGHNRLSIIDLSEAAAQPMSTADKRYTLSYNGELYNYKELGKALPKLASNGDTAVVLQALVTQGESALKNFNGMFALALWDEHEESLLLARDRYGQKPLYYHEREGRIYFASELKAFIKAGIVDATINPDALRDVLEFGSVHGPQTIIQGVHLLPQANYLKWSVRDGIKIQTYWTPSTEKKELSAERIKELLDQAVQRHLISDAPLGLFLSGGIDSSTILAAAAQTKPKYPIRALTVSFPDMPDNDELDFAEEMVRKTANVSHEIIKFSAQDCLDAVHKFADFQDQPSIDGLNTWIVSHAAQEAGIKAMLSGLGSDELFGGYETFYSIPKWIRLRQRIGPFSALLQLLIKHRPTFARFEGKLIDLLNSSGSPLEVYAIRRQLFSSRQQSALLAPTLKQQQTQSPELEILATLGQGRKLFDQIGIWEMYSYMSQTLLRDADTMGMKHSLEIRMPFLDNTFSENVLSLPNSTRTPQETAKHRLIEAISHYLPDQHLKQKKRGFCVPLEAWLPHELRDFAETGLHYLQSRDDLFDSKQIELLWNCFLNNPKKIGAYRPWSLILLGHYLKNL